MTCSRFLYCIVFLMLGHEVLSLKSDLANYGVEDAIEDISLFIPGSKLVLTTALKLARVYGEIRHYIDPNSTQILESLDKLNDKVDAVSGQLNGMANQLNSISEDVKNVKDVLVGQVLTEVPKDIHLGIQMKSIYDQIKKLNGLFHEFLHQSQNLHEYNDNTLLNFANKIIDTTSGIEYSILGPINNDVTEKYSHKNILEILADKRFAYTMMCNNNPPASSAEKIIHLYHDVMLTEVRGVILTEYAYSIKKRFEKNATYNTELEQARVHSYNRTISTIIDVKRALYKASRDFWTCDPSEHEEGYSHSKLGPIFQAYFLYEPDIGDKKFLGSFKNKCGDKCSSRIGSFPDICRSKQCKQYNKPCTGLLHNCETADTEIKFCAADNKEFKRYEYVELLGKGEILGRKKTCKSDHSFFFQVKKNKGDPCDVCICTCENAPSKMNRYFSLKSIISDVKSNKIITGLRLREHNNIFHIQIQQGQLQKDGNVDKTTVEWKPIDEYTVHDNSIIAGRDYHNITYANRVVLLDNIDSPKDNVLTGLRFQLEKGHLKLEIQTTPFNFSSGELKENESKWLSNSINFDERSEIYLENRGLPTSSFSNNRDSSSSDYFKFTTTSLKADVGQTIVPFIDLQEISSDPPLPLSGAGLIHKGNADSGGFLAMKIYTYNFAPHLHA